MKTGFEWWRMLGTAVLAVGGLAACQSVQTTHSGAVGVERRQMMMVSSREMEQASSQSYQKIIQDASQKKRFESGSGGGRSVCARLLIA